MFYQTSTDDYITPAGTRNRDGARSQIQYSIYETGTLYK